MARNDKSDKVELLAELLGEARVADLRKSGILPNPKQSTGDPASVTWHRNRLIEKFRERGLLPASERADGQVEEPKGLKNKGPKTRNAPSGFTPGAIGARLAKHLNPDRLADEHPAVIALFLRSQTPQLRSQVLRGLPGSQARAVMRVLRGATPAPKKETEIPQPERKPEARKQVEQSSSATEMERPNLSIRRAL